MKKILITGANSYIGTSFEKYMAQWPDEYQVDTIDMVDGSWRDKSFSGYDSVFHVAGIAHQDSGKITEERKQLYYKVNTDLAIETARKAKVENVPQFILMSSMIIYGASSKMGENKVITIDTAPAPVGAYGDSKLKADIGVRGLAESDFCVSVLRPPMIYGPNCKGNYPMLSKAARLLLFFPDFNNSRSMLFIGNLCAFIKMIIDNSNSGIFFPQNEEHVSTSCVVCEIAYAHGKKIKLTKIFNPLLRMLSGRITLVDKVFGNMVYDKDLPGFGSEGAPYTFQHSIKESEVM